MHKRQRMHWMDSLRGVAVSLVVLHHAINVPRVLGIGDGLPNEGWDGFVAFFSSFRMPLLLVMSGLLLGGGRRKPLLAYAGGKARKVLWPYVLWVCITVLLLGDPGSLGRPLTWLSGPFHMWFLAVLLGVYVAGWFTRWVPAWLMAAGMVLLLVVADPSTNWIRRLLFYGAFFMVGVALHRVLRQLLRLPGLVVGVLAVVALAVSSANMLDLWLPRLGHEDVWTWLVPWPGILAAMWLWRRLPRLRALEWMGRKSIVLYCVHFPAQGLSAFLFRDLAESSQWLFLFIQVVVGLGVPALFLWGYRYTKVLFELPPLRRNERRAVQQPVSSTRGSE